MSRNSRNSLENREIRTFDFEEVYRPNATLDFFLANIAYRKNTIRRGCVGGRCQFRLLLKKYRVRSPVICQLRDFRDFREFREFRDDHTW